MKLKKIIEKLFSKKQVLSTSIASLRDCIVLPTRQDIENNQEYITQLEAFKLEYSQILSRKKSITSCDLEAEPYLDNINMYITLLMNLIGEEDKSLPFDNASYYHNGTRKIEYTCKIGKLKFYLLNIKKIETTIILRLIALQELLVEKYLLFPTKKNAIKEEINNLSGSLCIIQNQKYAIKIEIENYLKEYESLNKEEFVNQEIDDALIKEKYQERLAMINLLSPDKLDQINQKTQTIADLVIMEEILENHIYKHQEETQKLKEELGKLSVLIKDEQELMKIESRIPELEIRIKAFAILGRNLISDEDIKTFYKIKFAVITRNIMQEKEITIAKTASHMELECYQEIIFGKIEDILTNKNEHIKSSFPKNQTVVIKAIVEVLKDGQNEYSFWNILNNKKLLCLILAFDKPNGLEEYFSSIKDFKWYYPNINFYDSVFFFNEHLPLATIFSMIYYNKQTDKNPLYEIYRQQKDQNGSYKFTIPEGVLYVDIQYCLDASDRNLIKTIRSNAQNSSIKTPKSLSEINGSLFKDITCESIELNEGLTKISSDAFININANSLSIPSTLSTIDYRAFYIQYINKIYIKDFSKMQLTPDSIKNLIHSLYSVVRAGEPCYQSKEYDSCMMSCDFILKPKCSSIIIEEDNQEIISIQASEITFKSFRTWTEPLHRGRIKREYSYGPFLSETEIEKAYELIINLIKEKLKAIDDSKKLEKISNIKK